MTVKGQITVPKDVRDLLGLKPGQKVGIETDPDGTVRIVKPDADAQAEQHKLHFLARLSQAQDIFAASDAYPGMSTDEFMATIREPLQPFEIAPEK